MQILKQLLQNARRLQWKLTFSYTAVTLGTLLLTVLILGFLLFSTILAPHELIPPDLWVNTILEQVPPAWRYTLSQTPVDTDLVNLLAREGFGIDNGFQVSYFNLLRVGDLQFTARMMGQASFLIVSPEGVLLGTSNPDWVSEDSVGYPLDVNLLPGLEVPLKNALSGELDPESLFVDIHPYEQFYFVIPIFDESQGGQVLGVAVFYVESIPTESDLFANSTNLVIRSLLIFLFAAGIIGTAFGFLTARGMSCRLQRVTQVTDSWSQGRFDESLEDKGGDEISQLVVHLNNMAEQLQQFMDKRQEIAVMEERNRLARDLHDSAKQEALAASFQIGSALSLLVDDPLAAKTHLQEAENLVDSVRFELTELIHELHPLSKQDCKFDERIQEYCMDWGHRNGIHIEVMIDVSSELPLEVKEMFYRILQEALANAARHSSAKNVLVRLIDLENILEFTVSDDGVGFDPQQQSTGMGLDSMRERTWSLKGEFYIESQSGKGTQVRVILPLG